MMKLQSYLPKILMTTQELIKKFNEFLFDQCGVTYAVFDHVRLDKRTPIKSLFFNPYKSPNEFFYQGASAITAPVCLTIITLELAAASVYLGLKSIVNLAKLNPQVAKIDIIDAAVYLVFSFIAAVVGVASPVINLIDFIGSGINSMIALNEPSQETQRPLNN
ncbi:putative integral membrane protein [Legionella moravica]|uniref:Integral membrane protein n=1 Tax=Legionella moravica TaxID=39962 RepID=A0A378JSG4_9GAMM|nr:hypothetical protein [Legionella moravica]KTD37482.1 putative integral membrane protein [Legionella moravica]STX61544.1 putative integral membrane protein [Legionella moravica]